MAMLQSGNPSELNAIAAEAAAGNIQEAARKLSGLLQKDEARELLKLLENQL